jgi:hypothetical protein
MSFIVVIYILLGGNLVGKAEGADAYPSLQKCSEHIEAGVEAVKNMVKIQHPELPFEKFTFKGECKLKGGEIDG